MIPEHECTDECLAPAIRESNERIRKLMAGEFVSIDECSQSDIETAFALIRSGCRADVEEWYRKVTIVRGAHATRTGNYIMDVNGDWVIEEDLLPDGAIPTVDNDRDRPRGTFKITVEFTPDVETTK